MQALEDRPGPPPRHDTPRGPHRATLHTRIRLDLDDLVRSYADQHGVPLQAVHEHALAEYFQRRGLLPEDEQR